MDNLNKTVSFILGLVVVLVFLAIITGRFNLKNKPPLMLSKVSPTPIVTTIPTLTSSTKTEESGKDNAYGSYKMKQSPSAIPATGSPTIFLPLLFSSLSGGFLIKKLGKK
ncbi:hypothetical protein HY041_00820 [Candidatus Roizmanbacteria bacterium]|nr:hypothetical protein [Candidatus Roizmanbacteria bacterium]